MNEIRLGIIGISEGNGHPYSWSAICNGYDKEKMKECPFPVISQYLDKQSFPEDALSEGKVTHIWTQDKKLSNHLASTVYIDHIVDHYTDMIGHVDAVLLARDDYENHFEFSKPFLMHGLPIYIDKPLANNRASANHIFSLEKYKGQIFTCTAYRFAKEFQLSNDEREQLGELQYVDACIMKSWDKYSIHLIEPVLNIIGKQGRIVNSKIVGNEEKRTVTLEWQTGLCTTFSTLGHIPSPIIIRLFGTKGYKELRFEDTFYAFKQSLQTFMDVIQKRQPPMSKDNVMDIMDIIETGNSLPGMEAFR
jgi:predicted dehydrogenase